MDTTGGRHIIVSPRVVVIQQIEVSLIAQQIKVCRKLLIANFLDDAVPRTWLRWNQLAQDVSTLTVQSNKGKKLKKILDGIFLYCCLQSTNVNSKVDNVVVFIENPSLYRRCQQYPVYFIEEQVRQSKRKMEGSKCITYGRDFSLNFHS